VLANLYGLVSCLILVIYKQWGLLLNEKQIRKETRIAMREG
jgi:hypothetical protein